LAAVEQLLVAVIWLRTYPAQLVLGFLFGVSGVTAGRLLGRWVPVLGQAGRTTMRLPDPGKKRHRTLDALLADTPELAVIIETFEQPVRRPQTRAEADGYYSGKMKRHTLKSQVAIDKHTGTIADVAVSVPGPTAYPTVLKDSGLMQRSPGGVGGLGDLAHIGLVPLHPAGLAATPRRKPRNQPPPRRRRGLQYRLFQAADQGRAYDRSRAALPSRHPNGSTPSAALHGAGRGDRRTGQSAAQEPTARLSADLGVRENPSCTLIVKIILSVLSLRLAAS
jgi:hypothetical protein